MSFSSKIKKAYYMLKNRLTLKQYGLAPQNCIIFNRVNIRIKQSAKVTIGDNFIFTSGIGTNPLSGNNEGTIYVDDNASLHIGNNVGMSSTHIWATCSITIGNNVKIGADVSIMDSDLHSLDYIERRSPSDKYNAKKLPIVIGDDVLLGARSIILKGCVIGNKCIIGAGSVVTKSFPENSIVGGNPARIIGVVDNK